MVGEPLAFPLCPHMSDKELSSLFLFFWGCWSYHEASSLISHLKPGTSWGPRLLTHHLGLRVSTYEFGEHTHSVYNPSSGLCFLLFTWPVVWLHSPRQMVNVDWYYEQVMNLLSAFLRNQNFVFNIWWTRHLTFSKPTVALTLILWLMLFLMKEVQWLRC